MTSPLKTFIYSLIASFLSITVTPAVAHASACPEPPQDKTALPIVKIPAVAQDTLPMAFLISGDGGWSDFDQAIGKALANKGIPVIGLDARKYFWNAKTPEETTASMVTTIQQYMHEWKKSTFILVGYSYGACIIPFIATRLTGSIQRSLTGIYCLSPDITVDFEIHLVDMVGIRRAGDLFKVPEEMLKIKSFQPFCIFGDGEDSKLRTRFEASGAKVALVPGNHHYNYKASVPVGIIVKEVEARLKK